MKHFIIFSLFLFSCCFSVSAQFKSGMIFSGGSSFLSNVKEGHYLQEIINMGGTKSSKYQFNAAIGYKFRIQPQNKSYFFDADLYAGLKRFNLDYSYNEQETTDDGHIIFGGVSSRASATYYYFAINPTYNFKVYKNLHLGAGIEPTLYFADGDNDKWRFDIPPTLRIGYDFKHWSIAVGCKVGVLNAMKSKSEYSRLKAGNLNDLQIQLFMPF